MNDTKRYSGGCHCGAIRFEAEIDFSRGVSRCNCTICHKLGRAGVLLRPEAFTLRAGEDSLSSYVWGSRMGAYLFCNTCGVHSFSRGHLDVLGGDFVSVNANCLDDLELLDLPTQHWDGRHDNWQAGARDTPWRIDGRA